MDVAAFKASLLSFVESRHHSDFKYYDTIPYPYAVARKQITPSSTPSNIPRSNIEIDEDDETLIEPNDPSLAAACQLETTATTTLELHITYSPTYQTPTLLFAAWDTHGSPISYLDYINPDILSMNPNDNQIMSPVITQQDHPALRIPFFALHPCNSHALVSEMIRESLSGGNTGVDYLETWWSLSIKELNEAQPISPEALQGNLNVPPEPLWWNVPASTSIRRYLVLIPILLAFSLAINVYSIKRFNDANIIFNTVDLLVITGFNVLGYMAVDRRIPEWMALFIYYYIFWGAIKVVWSIVYYTVLYKNDMNLDSASFENVKYVGLGTGVVVTIAYTVWIVWRAFIPFREYSIQCREALKAAEARVV
ncbi:hypothetical protein BDR26DRAFT_933023 [Obelidium mucronatum]|nr:hypothetical protein BDR26DRAFT_933023 [Obelidium mucronatum]